LIITLWWDLHLNLIIVVVIVVLSPREDEAPSDDIDDDQACGTTTPRLSGILAALPEYEDRKLNSP
jgi:hypothetical protein